jgi:MFS family permease
MDALPRTLYRSRSASQLVLANDNCEFEESAVAQVDTPVRRAKPRPMPQPSVHSTGVRRARNANLPVLVLCTPPAGSILSLFLVLLLAYTLSQFYRAFLAVIAPELSVELRLTASDLANMSAAWFAVFALAQFPLGIALDRIGPRRCVPIIMLAAVAGALLLAHAQGPLACIVANALIGLGCSPIYMGALFVFARTTRPERFGFISACLQGLGSGGNLLAATPLALSAEHFGWRASFAGIGILTLASALLFWLVVRDPAVAERPKGRTSAVRELAPWLRHRCGGTRSLVRPVFHPSAPAGSCRARQRRAGDGGSNVAWRLCFWHT